MAFRLKGYLEKSFLSFVSQVNVTEVSLVKVGHVCATRPKEIINSKLSGLLLVSIVFVFAVVLYYLFYLSVLFTFSISLNSSLLVLPFLLSCNAVQFDQSSQ